MVIVAPPLFVHQIVRREGSVGERWLAGLSASVDVLLRRWGCVLSGTVLHGGVALVVPVRRETREAVIKVSFPHEGNRNEASALRRAEGQGAVELLDVDDELFALLLERAGPATLADVGSIEERIEVAGGLARRLAVPAGDDLRPMVETAAEWELELDRQLAAAPGVVSARAERRARATIAALAVDTTQTMLHGDLHPGNVLRGRREAWLAIDPKGWRGPPEFDAFTMVVDGHDELMESNDLERALRGRIRRFAAAAGVDASFALACCQARAVSSLLYETLNERSWFAVEVLRTLTEFDR